MKKITLICEKMEELNLKCQDCNTNYTKPIIFQQYSETEKHTHFFFKRCLKYCDKCRRIRERKMIIEGLPKVINALSSNLINEKQ